MAHPMMHERIWFESWRVNDAETLYQEKLAQRYSGLAVQDSSSSLVSQIAKARQQIKNSLEGVGLAVGVGVENAEVLGRLERLEQENVELRKVTQDLQSVIKKMESRVASLEKAASGAPSAKPAPAPAAADDDDDDDEDDFELFGSDDDDEEDKEELEKIKQQRVAEYQAKKAKKPGVIAKSSVIFDVKPWDDETDMKELEKCVRSVEMDGLLWGASKLVPVGYGIKKLQISSVIEDEKVSTEEIEERVTAFEDYVQSVDIAAFNKI